MFNMNDMSNITNMRFDMTNMQKNMTPPPPSDMMYMQINMKPPCFDMTNMQKNMTNMNPPPHIYVKKQKI